MNFKVERFSTASILWSVLSLLWMSNFHPFAVLSSIGVVAALFFQDKVALTSRGLGAVGIAALMLCFLCTRTIERDATGRFLGIGTISLAILGAVLLIAALLIKKKGNLTRAPLSAAFCILVACSMSTDMVSVIVITFVSLVLITLSLREALGLKPNLSLILPGILTLCLVGSLATLATWSESKVGYLASLFALTPASGVSFPPTTTLNSLQRSTNSDLVILRGYGKTPPLYLVGRTFTEFDNNSFWKWKTDKDVISPKDQVLVETVQGPQALSFFQRDPSPQADSVAPFRIEFPKSGNGFTIYSPRNFQGVAVDLRRMHRYGDGMLQALATDSFDGNFYLFPFKNGWVPQDSSPEISPEYREECLALPDELTKVIPQLAEEIAGEVDDPALKADFITNYLQQNFTYGYEYPFESTKTALEEFLTKKPPAHCEFFATSAALMLRSQGVPTRYINGFVMQEKAITGGYYVVRLKHAHAWVEVYLPDKGWVTYDPTPPGTLGDPDERAHIGEALLEWLSNIWRRFFNFFTLSPTQMLEEIRAFFATWTWIDYLKLAVLYGLWRGWKRYRRRVTKTAQGDRTYDYTPGRDETITPALEAVTELIYPDEWRRFTWETPKQWLHRLGASNLEPKTLLKLTDFLNLYTKLRFSPSPADSDRTQLAELSADLHSELKGKSLRAQERQPDQDKQ
jgi:transglutaminase-like putative cysteine protease